MVLRTIAVLLLAATLAASPQVLPIGTAYACSCVQSNLDEHVERANLIVLGTVVRIDEVANEDLTDELRTNYNLTVAVGEQLKGSAPASVTVRDATLQSSACSAFSPDAVGQEFLLFLRWNDDGLLTTSSCAGSATVWEDPAFAEHVEQIRETQEEGGNLLLPIAAGIVGAVALVGLGAAAWRSVRHR